MTVLREYLQAIPGSRVVVRHSTGSMTCSELLCCWSDERRSRCRGRNVLLYVGQIQRALPALVQLDGVATQILLTSRNLSVSDTITLGQQAGCDLVLDDGDLQTEWPAAWQRVPLMEDEWSPADEASHEVVGRRDSVDLTTQWLLPTSGTTGIPKIVSHTLASLTRTTKVDIQRGADCRWGLLYDYARFAGLQVVLQAMLSGSTLIAPQLSESLEQQVQELVAGACTHLSATPTLWRKILMTPSSEQLELKQVTLGGEIAEQRVLDALRLRFPKARISHIYASTEAGVGFSVSDGREGFPAHYLDSPPGEIELRVLSGKLYVRNPSVQPRYVGTETGFADDQGFVDTGDRVEQRGDRYVFLGRETGVINVGGNKVHPEEVEQVLLSHPEVWQAKVAAKRNPIMGSLVVAEIVPLNDGSDRTSLRDSILDHCRTRLDRHKVPALINFVKELPCSATGKLARDHE